MNECIQIAERLGLSPESVVELWAERAAIREYEGGQPRVEAESAAVDDVRTQLAAGLSTITIGERKGPRSAAVSATVDVLADTHKR